MKIVFWSLYHGQSGTTSNMLALSGYMALNSMNKTLVMHNQLKYSALEYYLNLQDIDTATKGIDPVLVHLKNMSLKPEEVHEYTTSILKNNRYDVLQGTKHNEQSIYQEFTDIFAAGIDLANRYYDYVFIDASAGQNNGIRKLMEVADIIVLNVNQNKFVLEETQKVYNEIQQYHDKVMVLVGNYESENKLTLKNIKSSYKFKKVYKIGYNAMYKNYLNTSKILEFLHVNKDVKRFDPVYNVMKDIEEAGKGIITFFK